MPEAVADRARAAGSDPFGRVRRLGLALTSRLDVCVLLVVCAFGLAYESHFLFRGWIPHDEGALSESARRILAGQLPHRDFAEIYSGGLGYLHALAFLLFGEKLASMRIVLFTFFAVWIPVLYRIARRFASPSVAGACVIACIAWSVPNYSAPMPSWYNLFFATFAVAFFFRYCDERRSRWLFATGLACGVSIIIKQTGIYIAVGLLLVLLFEEQALSERVTGRKRSPYVGFVVACAAATVVFLVLLVHRRLGAAEITGFVVPGSCIAAFLAWNETRLRRVRTSVRFRSLLVHTAWFGFGLALPIGVFISPYVVSGSVGSLLDGALVEPSARLTFAALKPPTLWVLPITLLVLMLFVSLGRALSHPNVAARVAAGGILIIWFAFTGRSRLYELTAQSVREASLFVVPVGAALLATATRRNASTTNDTIRTFALLALFAFATLIQFPFSAPIYFCYVAPLMFLALLAVAAHWREAGRAALSPVAIGALFLFLAAFGVARVNQHFIGGRLWIGAGEPLGLERSGPLRVSPAESRLYRRIVARIEAAGTGSYIYAGPDAPELYFLANRRNPTRAQFEFLEIGPMQDRDLLRALDRHRVSLVALNLRPTFSPPLDPGVREALAERYPLHERIGRFELRWRA